MLRLIFLLIITSCSHYKFQKKADGLGYTVKELTGPLHFEIKVDLPSSARGSDRRNYVWLAAMEECYSRGNQFVFHSPISDDLAEIRCLPRNEFIGLGVAFEKKGLSLKPSKFIVEKTQVDSSKEILSGDIVISINGDEFPDINKMKKILQDKYRVGEILEVKVIRNDRIVELKIPTVLVKDKLNGGMNDIKSLRLYFD